VLVARRFAFFNFNLKVSLQRQHEIVETGKMRSQLNYLITLRPYFPFRKELTRQANIARIERKSGLEPSSALFQAVHGLSFKPFRSRRSNTALADGVLRAERASRPALLVCSVPYSQPDFQRPHPPNCPASFVNRVKKSETIEEPGKRRHAETRKVDKVAIARVEWFAHRVSLAFAH
jgi:hypothetical protein